MQASRSVVKQTDQKLADVPRMALALALPTARFQEPVHDFGVLLEKSCEVSEHIDSLRTQMMFDSFDVVLLDVSVQSQQREKTREGLMPLLDFGRDGKALFGQDEPAIFFVVEVTKFPQLLHHARHRSLFDVQ